MVVSIRFDTETALACATERQWSVQDWADQAEVSLPTLRLFLSGDDRLKLRTIEQILRPLGIRAYDIILTLPPLEIRPRGPVFTGQQT